MSLKDLNLGPRTEDEKKIAGAAAAILAEMEKEEVVRGPGLRCPKCGAMLAHYRLYGYRCIHGCQ